MRTLWLYQTPLFSIRRTSEVITEDQKEQARILCVVMTTALPSGVLRAFCEMTGGDYEKVFDIGNEYVKDNKMHVKKKKKTLREMTNSLPEEVVNKIKTSFMSYKEISELFDVDIGVVRFIRSPSVQ